MNAADRFLISYLVPEISMFKEAKHDMNNSQNSGIGVLRVDECMS